MWARISVHANAVMCTGDALVQCRGEDEVPLRSAGVDRQQQLQPRYSTRQRRGACRSAMGRQGAVSVHRRRESADRRLVDLGREEEGVQFLLFR